MFYYDRRCQQLARHLALPNWLLHHLSVTKIALLEENLLPGRRSEIKNNNTDNLELIQY